METQNTPYTGSDADACHYLLTMTLWAPPEEPFQGRRIAPCIHQDSTQLRPVTNWCLFVPSQSSLQSVVKCRLLPKNTESRSVLHVCCTWYICNMPLISDWKQRILWIEIGAIFAKFHHSVHHALPAHALPSHASFVARRETNGFHVRCFMSFFYTQLPHLKMTITVRSFNHDLRFRDL